jgi:hypothetical protein
VLLSNSRMDSQVDNSQPVVLTNEEEVRIDKVRKLPWRKMMVFASMTLVLLVLVFISRQQVRPGSKAAGEQVAMYLSPSKGTMPPGLTETIRIDSGAEKVGFVKVVLTFDVAKVRLAGEIATTNLLKTVVQKTSMVDANASGKIEVALGLSTTDKENAPSGDFDIGQIPFTVVSNTGNDAAKISFNVPSAQVVNIAAGSLTLGATPAMLTLNPVTPTPTPKSPTSTPTPIRTPTPTPKSPTSTPTPIRTPTPTPRPLVPTPTSIAGLVAGDLNKDGCVNYLDVRYWYRTRHESWGKLTIIFKNWGQGCASR